MSKKLFGKVFIFLLVVGLLFAVAPTKQVLAQTAGVNPSIQAAADRIVGLQRADGGWGWPLTYPEPDPSAMNILAPIGKALAEAYRYTNDPDHLNALQKAGVLFLTKSVFTATDYEFAQKLDAIFGGTTYTTFVKTNFYDKLAAGTYYSSTGGPYTTQQYVDVMRAKRAGTQANMAAWDLGMSVASAVSAGVTNPDLGYWIAGLEAEINELYGGADQTNYLAYDVIGLAGAVYGLAVANVDFDPIAGEHAAATSTADLAAILASYQIDGGGFAWNKWWVIPNDFDEDMQATSYAILALNTFNRSLYLDKIQGAAEYALGIQLSNGGWYTDEFYDEENVEVDAEVLWAITATYPYPEVWVCLSGDCGHPGFEFSTIQAAIDTVDIGGIVNVFPGAYNETALGRTLDNGGTYQFGLFFDSAKPGITLQGVKADGTVITDAVDVVASIKTNATNSFGYSGVFVEADDITITGFEFLDNYVLGAVDNNKTLEVIGDNFAFKDNVMSVAGGGSLYLNDWSYDSGTGISRVETYNISENLFKFGASVDISSGVGVSGLAASRVIANNTFTADGEDVYWANISFNGTIPSVGWFVYPVGGATITGNTFVGGEMPIRSRGIVEDDFNWASYITGNNFEKAVIAWDIVNDKPRAYTYTSGPYTLNNVILIGTIIQDEIGHAQPGDEVRVIKGTFNEAVNVNKAVTIVGTGEIEPFTDPITIGATQAPGTWYTDRYAPGVFENSTFLGEPVLLHGVRAVDLQPTPFYNTQGRKFDIGLTGPTQLISIDMFVGEDWGTKTRYSGLWATGFDILDEISAYPILAWRNNEGDGPGFFAYDYNAGAWLKLRDAVPQDYGKWHTFEIELTVGTGVKYFVDGESLLTFADADTVSFGNVILNVKNFGEDYDVYWDNFAAHDTKVIGQMSINASDVAIKGLILSNPGQAYGMLIDDLASNIDITENIFVDIGSPTLAQNVKGVYLQYGPDDVFIKDNLFERIHANTNSVNAIFSGDSNSTSPAELLEIRDNRFLNITSQTKGGYGILLNNGAGNPGAIIDGNRFSGIRGGWTHAIGLEGPTANAVVTGNTFYNLTALSPDNLAVLFEDNPVGDSVEVSGNRFQNVGYGVGVNPDDITAYNYTVDATLNYWGSPCGPAAGVANVGPNVTYNPFYTTVELTTTGAGFSGSYTFPSGSTTEFMNATIACAAPGSTLTFDGLYPGGIIIPADRTDLTFKISNDTVITGTTEAGYCFNVFGDYTRIETENFEYGLPKCVPAGDSSGIYVNWTPLAFGMPADNQVLDLIIDGLEIDGTDMTQSGITLSGDITDVQILNNYIHHSLRALTADHDIQGRFDIQGNMFKDNTYNVVDLASPSQGIVASYNSWGVYPDPTAGLVGAATYTPWTHMELFIEHVAGSSPWVNQLVSNGTMEITYSVKADMKEITGAEFLLKIPAGLTVKSTTAADVFDFQSASIVTGGVQYYGAQFDPDVPGSEPVTGEAITLFTVTLTASAPGTYDLTIDETTDAFSMLPPMEPAPSTWVYLDEAHKATLLAIELPAMTSTLTDNYEIGVAQEFTVTITNPVTGGEFTDPVLVFAGLPAGTTLEYYNGSAWVTFTGVITPDLLNDDLPVVLQFRVTFTAPAGAYPITITLNDSLTTPDEFLAQTSGKIGRASCRERV